jgi:hypothetical protein
MSFETEELVKKIQLILRQTDYNEEIARDKLEEFKYDELKVIRAYLGLPDKKEAPIKSVNQEIYKQMRYKLDENMRDYNIRKERGETKTN